ncbi:MAG TPA: molybdopterin-binding protein [Firmicutes bacterium]|jgi:molybdopterin biosynthesis enzyme|nr:molybdopterin-binding protein [Bacillota bacterium]
MKVLPVEKAIGQVLGQDLTKIIPGEFKGPAFRKGRIIKEEDIPHLLQMGKENVFVYELDENSLHENDAARILAAGIAGEGMALGEAKEGRANLLAVEKGLLKVDVNGLYAANRQQEIAISSIHNNSVVNAGDLSAAVKIIPLVVEKKKIEDIIRQVKENGPLVSVKPLKPLATSLIITGNEVYHGRIADRFAPVIEAKMQKFDCEIISKEYLPDDSIKISDAIKKARDAGAGLILVTGGMAVDPDDSTPAAILAAGGQAVSYGVPLMPGAMFMLAYLDDLPIMGLPGGAMYYKTTVFDLLLPRILAGERVQKEDIVVLSHGGLCLTCSVCTYPKCHFGKSI